MTKSATANIELNVNAAQTAAVQQQQQQMMAQVSKTCAIHARSDQLEQQHRPWTHQQAAGPPRRGHGAQVEVVLGMDLVVVGAGEALSGTWTTGTAEAALYPGADQVTGTGKTEHQAGQLVGGEVSGAEVILI